MKNSKEKIKKTELVLSTPVTDVLSNLEQMKQSLDKIYETPYRTSKQITGLNSIQESTSVEDLLKTLAFIQTKEKAYNNALETITEKLGRAVSASVFKLEGFTLEEFEHDICLRIEVIEHKAKYDKLSEFQNKMKEFLSKEDQKQILYNEIENFMKTV
jgi:hypothetical protein